MTVAAAAAAAAIRKRFIVGRRCHRRHTPVDKYGHQSVFELKPIMIIC